MPKAAVSYRKAIYSALEHLLSTDPLVVFMGEDIAGYGGAFGVSSDLHARFPDRVLSTPISEGGFTGVAVGLAITGFRPVVEIMFMDFMTLAMDQLVNHASNIHYMYAGQLTCPLVIRTPAGGYRGYGASHSNAFESLFMSVPGLKIVAPATVRDAYGCLISAVYDNNPVLFVEHKLLYDIEEDVTLDPSMTVPLGKARVARSGTDATVVTHSYGLKLSLEAAAWLAEERIDVEVIDLRTLKPLDIDLICESVSRTGRVVCVEEGNVFGGIGAEVASQIAEKCLPYLDGRILRVGKPDSPIPASLKAESFVLPGVKDVVRAVKKSLTWR